MSWRTSAFLVASMLGATACALIAGIDPLSLGDPSDAGSPSDAAPDRRSTALPDGDMGGAGSERGETSVGDGEMDAQVDASLDGSEDDASLDADAGDASVDTDAGDPMRDGDSSDASLDGGQSDTSLDGGQSDARDGGSGNGCPSAAGPSMVRVKTIDGRTYCIDSTEVTQQQYAQFLVSKKGDTSGQDARCGWNTSYGVQCAPFNAVGMGNYPVACVDWCDAVSYCAWAGKRLCGKIGGGSLTRDYAVYNDNTQSEKFSACSQNGNFRFPYGNVEDVQACIFAGTSGGTSQPVGSAPRCVGGFPGIYDIIGNVHEWEDVCDTDTPDAGTSQTMCGVRGGDFNDNGWACDDVFPLARSTATYWAGFRCCAN